MAVGDYTGLSFSTAGASFAPKGITWDGTNFWILKPPANNKVYQFDASGTYTGFYFDPTSSGNAGARDITWDGTYLWISDYEDDLVYQYTTAGVYTGVNFSTSSTGDPDLINFDGTYFWIVNHNNAEVYQYSYAGIYTGIHYDISSQSTDPSGLLWDGTYFWVNDQTNAEVYQYDSSFTYTGFHFDTNTAGNNNGYGMVWDGAIFYITDFSDFKVYKYVGTPGIFPPFGVGTLPVYSTSLITAVQKVEQALPFTKFVIAGRNASTYKLFKKSTTYAFNLWRSPVYQIGQNFDILAIRIPIMPDMTTNMSIIPVLYFDNEDSNSVGTTLNSTNYPNSDRLIYLTDKDFTNTVHGRNNFFLELQFTGSALSVVELPISIDLEVQE